MRRLVVTAWLAGVAAGCGDSNNKTEIPKNVPPPPSASQLKAEAGGGQQQKGQGTVSSGAEP